jgi:hypothetical protein
MSKVGLIGTLRGDNLARRVLIQNYPIRPDQRDSRALFSMEFAAPFRPGSYHNFDKPSISTGERAETTEREEAKASEQASPFLSEDFDAPSLAACGCGSSRPFARRSTTAAAANQDYRT